MGNRLAADQSALLEEPLMGSVELLEGVVAQHRGTRLLGDVEHEGIAAADRAGGWRDQFVVGDRLVELGSFRLVDAMTEGGVDHHGDRHIGVIRHERCHRLVQLLETRHGATLGRDVGPVDHDVARSCAVRHVFLVSDPLGSCGVVRRALGLRAVTSIRRPPQQGDGLGA